MKRHTTYLLSKSKVIKLLYKYVKYRSFSSHKRGKAIVYNKVVHCKIFFLTLNLLQLHPVTFGVAQNLETGINFGSFPANSQTLYKIIIFQKYLSVMTDREGGKKRGYSSLIHVLVTRIVFCMHMYFTRLSQDSTCEKNK